MRQKGQNEAHLNVDNGLMCSVRVPRPFLTWPVNITIKILMLWECILDNMLHLSNSTIVWCPINAGYWWKPHMLWYLIKPGYRLWTDTYRFFFYAMEIPSCLSYSLYTHRTWPSDLLGTVGEFVAWINGYCLDFQIKCNYLFIYIKQKHEWNN